MGVSEWWGESLMRECKDVWVMGGVCGRERKVIREERRKSCFKDEDEKTLRQNCMIEV